MQNEQRVMIGAYGRLTSKYVLNNDYSGNKMCATTVGL